MDHTEKKIIVAIINIKIARENIETAQINMSVIVILINLKITLLTDI